MVTKHAVAYIYLKKIEFNMNLLNNKYCQILAAKTKILTVKTKQEPSTNAH
jgi:hypothetical protein